MIQFKKIEKYTGFTFWNVGLLLTIILNLINGSIIFSFSKITSSVFFLITPIMIAFIMTYLRNKKKWRWWIATSLGVPIGTLPFTIFKSINEPYDYDFAIASWKLVPITFVLIFIFAMVLSAIGIIIGQVVQKANK